MVGDSLVRVFCAILIVGFIFYYFWQYEYWKKKDPDRLHSEWLISEKIKAEMGIKGESPEFIEGKEIVNPPKELPEGGGDE